ncbi:MAG: F0F1 ATP synthase subunit A [Gammaproteobacteria bacterium]
MPEHELWFTALFNKYLSGPANAALSLVGLHAENPAKPWANFITMEILVVAILMIVAAMLRPKLSVDQPGKLQHTFEILYGFLRGQSEEVIGHHGPHFLRLFATLFFFILACNLIGIVPTFESPTMFVPVPLGCALVTFGYYHYMGLKEQGAGNYLKHFTGGVPWILVPLIVPIEIISHLARPLSLTIRLFANMFAGEQVTIVFLMLTYFIAPVIFMGLHVFVAFLQAYIFALLTMVYVQGAVSHEH